MGVVFLFIKIFPFFGLSLMVGCLDLARSFRRKGNRAWIGMTAFALFFLALSIVWLVFRGDRNADIWFKAFVDWVHGK